MSWGDIVALVGAAAWLPQIWRYLQKPKVSPIVGGQIEIGFFTLGPLFNPKIAFRTERRSALITGIEYRVQHERGQVTTFRCVQLVESGAQSESTSGEKAFHQRLQDVVAVVLVPTVIVERKTNSREVACLDNLETLNIALGRTVDRLRRDGTDWIADVERSPEYGAILRFLTDSFVWQPGNYEVACSVTVAGQARPSTCSFRFVLGDGAVALLRTNLSIIERGFREGLLPEDARSKDKAPSVNWVYPYALASK